jgi:hypothetical protein
VVVASVGVDPSGVDDVVMAVGPTLVLALRSLHPAVRTATAMTPRKTGASCLRTREKEDGTMLSVG